MPDELKPCPNPACEQTCIMVDTTYRHEVYVSTHCFCAHCGTRGPWCKDGAVTLSMEEAVAAWNALPRRSDLGRHSG
ncbi:MAG: hypothetical protein FWF99_06905 [Desulfovibrionaceae bacterium]|nr:hypothetical protein [Desulfovibrionaceae bacterium]